MKKLALMFIIVLAAGCVSLGPRGSICDNINNESSHLCQVADDLGTFP